MEPEMKVEPMLQWHPAFFAGIRIEFREEESKVQIESEHQLGTKPMQIDVLIVKKNSKEPMEKNIGRIFRGHNIVEYKSPSDYLSVDDFYKVYGYACFYKADVTAVDSIRVEEITLTFVSKGYPKKLVRHLEEVRGFRVEAYEPGIYYVKGDVFPIQLIVTSQLSKEQNFWLRNLTDDLKGRDAVKELAKAYRGHHENTLYRSVMNVIIKANKELFKEESGVCEAIIDLFRDDYDKGIADAKELGVSIGVQRGREAGRKEGREEGCELGSARRLKENITNLMLSLQVSTERACEMLGTTKEEYAKACELLEAE